MPASVAPCPCPVACPCPQGHLPGLVLEMLPHAWAGGLGGKVSDGDERATRTVSSVFPRLFIIFFLCMRGGDGVRG